MKKTLFCLFLCLCICLNGCAAVPALLDNLAESMSEIIASEFSEQITHTEPSEQEPTDENPQTDPSSDSSLHDYVPYEDYERIYEPYLEEIPFSEIKYQRPDAQALCKGYADVQAMVEANEDVNDIIDAFSEVFEDYLYFDTMSTYAYIRYTLDLNDSYYDTEYNWCEEQSPLISQAEEKCYIAMAKSPLREELEELYFEEGFFDFYDDNQIYSKDRVVELMQQESDLQAQYMALQSDMTITWKGEEALVDELLNDPSVSYDDYLEIYELYYEKYNPLCAELYIQLLKVRKEIAVELEYDQYADFAYSYTYERDYTPEQVEAYCDDIADEMVSLLFTAAMVDSPDKELSTEDTMDMLQATANTFGGSIRTAHEYMQAWELYDITESSSKMPGSYMTYLNSYEMPFMYVSPTGTINDFLTATHEFGHFVDGYVNCGGSSSIDCSEIFSQGLEFLALNRAEMNARDRAALKEYKAADSVMVFLTQACYAEFEHRAFSLSEEELTPERLNELFMECNEKYGISLLYYGSEQLLAPGWIDVQHFFIAPYYVISYCVSNDAALQIYQNELRDGSGLDTYYELMEVTSGSSLLYLLEEAGMTSPFAEGRIEELADFLDDQMN